MYTWLPLPLLPHPPEEFVVMAKSAAMELLDKYNHNVLERKFDSKFTNRVLEKNGVKYNSRSLAGAKLGPEFEHWIKNNIVEDFIEAGVRISLGNNTEIHGVHTDGVLKGAPLVKLNYYVELGGDNVVTSFYQEIDQPLERRVNLPDVLTVNNYNNLRLIEQTVFAKSLWTALNTNVLHGVENITGHRINFTVLVDGTKLQFAPKLLQN